MKKQAFNPYLPSWEYIPDGEPYVFGDRVYIYGSHDFFNGYVFCMGDYVCWSAPVDDLSDWRYEGVIYPRNADPRNKDGKMCLYAPDVTVGPDGRYYLYYVLDKLSIISVAVCDTPAGNYEFYGYVHYPDGTLLGEKEGDEPQFDPGVLTEGDVTYLYSGFCPRGDKSRTGSKVVTLDKDMLTVTSGPQLVFCGYEYSADKDYKGHSFFEASSIRKVNGKYYFIYSSEVMHELCYAISDSPIGGFDYKGVLVSNADIGIDSYKPADMPIAAAANNHGSIVEINGDWYIFYHRHTNNTWYSRQGCAEKLTLLPDGTFVQAEITSCGLNGAPLAGEGTYPSYIACHLFKAKPELYIGGHNAPRVQQDGKDGDIETGYIANITDGVTIGFKYFEFKDVKTVTITTRAYAKGYFDVKTSWDGESLGRIDTDFSNVWEKHSADIALPDGVHPLYFTYHGDGSAMFGTFTLNK